MKIANLSSVAKRSVFVLSALFLFVASLVHAAAVSVTAEYAALATNATNVTGLAVDSSSNVYFISNNQVIMSSLDGVQTVVVSSGLSNPNGLAIDSSGNIYIANTGGANILKVTCTGSVGSCTYGTQAALNITGQTLSTPYGVAVDSLGNLFIADSSQAKVVKTTVNGGAATLIGSGMSGPQGVAVDSLNNIYVADTGNNRILKLAVTTFTQTIPITGAAGLTKPTGVALDAAGNIYTANTGSTAGTNGLFNGTSALITGLGLKNSGTTQASGVAVNAAGDIFVADTGNGRVLEENTGANFGSIRLQAQSNAVRLIFVLSSGSPALGGVAVTAQGGQTSQDFIAAPTQSATSCVSGMSNTTCTVDVMFKPTVTGLREGAVTLFTTAGAQAGIAYLRGIGTGPQLVFRPGKMSPIAGYGAGRDVSNPQLTQSKNLVMDAAGYLYIANYSSCTISKYAPGVPYYVWQLNIATAASCPTTGSPGRPRGVWVDGAGNIFMANSDSNQIVKYPILANGNYGAGTTPIPGTFVTPSSVVVDGSGNVFFTDSQNSPSTRVMKSTLSVSGTYTTTAIATYGASANPWGLAVDSIGNVYVGLNNSKSVVKLVPNADGTYTQKATVASGLMGPFGMGVDASGGVYIADTNGTNGAGAQSQIVLALPTTAAGTLYTQSVLYTVPVTSGCNQAGTICNPGTSVRGVAIDKFGNVYMADQIVNTPADQSTIGTIWKLNVADPPEELEFNSTYVGHTSTDSPQSFGLSNIGNADLDIPVPTTGTNPSLGADFQLYTGSGYCNVVTSTSSADAIVPSGSTCNLAVSFVPRDPQGAGVDFEQLVLTNNSMYTNPMQQINVLLAGSGMLLTIKPNGVPNSWPANTAYPSTIISAVDLYGGLRYPYSVSPTLVSGLLPPGMSLVHNPDGTVTLGGTPTTAGTYSFTVQGTDSTTVANGGPYSENKTYTITITQNATIAWSDPAAIVYGTPLSATQLNAVVGGGTCDAPMVYSPAAGAILPAGTQTLTASCAVSGTTLSASVTLLVNPATVTITATDTSRAYGMANPALSYTSTSLAGTDTLSMFGAVTIATTATTSSSVGTYPITVTGNLVSPNYNFVYQNGNLTITQANSGTNPGDSSTSLQISDGVSSPSASATVMYGNQAELYATVAPTGATGTLTFTAVPQGGGSAIALGASTPDSTGLATLPESTLAAGTYTITAVYGGDVNIASSTSNPVTLTVTKRTAPDGTSAALTIRIDNQSRSANAPNPTFTWGVTGGFINGDTAATAVSGTPTFLNVNGGSIPGTFTIAPDDPAAFVSQNYVIAIVNGTLTVNSDAGSDATTTVVLPSGCTVASLPCTTMYGDTVTLTATVTPGALTVPMSGTVSFYDGSTYLGNGTVSSGVASITVATLNAGNHNNITAVYNGDGTYTSSTSAATDVLVTRRTAPDGSAALIVTVQDASRLYGAVDPTFAYLVTGTLVNGDTYATAVTGTPAYTTNDGSGHPDTSTSPAGSMFDINLSGITSSNYAIQVIPGTLTITGSTPTTTSLAVDHPTSTYGSDVTFTATVTPGMTDINETMVLMNGSNVIDTAQVTGGTATFDLSDLPAGTYTMTAQYQGDDNYSGSTSNPVTITVNPKPLMITVNNVSRAYGLSNPSFSYVVDTTALVNGDTAATAIAGAAVYATNDGTSNPIGLTTAVGTYTGAISITGGLSSTNYSLSYTNGVFTITQGTPTMSVTAGPPNAAPGDTVTITATIPADATGTVTFRDASNNVLCTATITTPGTASCTTTALPVGTDTINASYSGDTNYTTATGTTTETITKATPTMSVTSGPANAQVGDTVTITATVPADATGTVTFKDASNNVLCTATISNPAGTASCTTTALPAGTDTINASYPGDTKYNSTTASTTQVIVKDPTNMSVTSGPSNAVYGDTVTITATVPSDATGTVTFKDASNNVLCTATISSGTASCTTTTLPAGTDAINASYPGDAKYQSDTAATTQLVAKATPSISVTASPAATNFGSPVTLTATVPSDATGTVTFTDASNNVLCTATVSTPAGTASCSTSALPVGTDTVIATYGGNSNYNSASASTTHEVDALAVSVVLVVSPSTVMYGDTAVMTASVTPGSTGTVSFYAGSTFLGTASVSATGIAELPENTLAVGNYTITAVYGGDPSHASGMSNNAPLQVTKRMAPDGTSPALVITVGNITRTVSDSSTPAYSYTVSGQLVNGDTYATAVTGTPNYSMTPESAAGVYPSAITLSGLTSANYTITIVPGTLTLIDDTTAKTPTIALQTSTSETQYGNPVTFTATVPTDATGTVSFYDGPTYLGEGSISSGVATLTTSTLNAGVHNVTAQYNGDASYSSITSSPVQVTIDRRTAPNGTSPALVITVQNTSRVFGTPDPQFTNVVTGALVNGDTYATAITGVPVYATADASNQPDTLASPSGSTFSINLSGLSSQNYLIQIIPGQLTIVDSASNTSLTVGPTNTPTYGDPVTLTSQVAPCSVAGDLVVFTQGSVTLGTAVVDSTGKAELILTTLPAGTDPITSTYQGNANCGSSTSDPVIETVQPKPLTITVNSASRTYGTANPAFGYTVDASALVNGDTAATAVRGVAAFATSATLTSPVNTTATDYPITYVNGLSSANYALTFVPGYLTITKSSAPIAVISSDPDTTYGEPVTFTATVPPGGTGTVTFTDGGTPIAGCTNVPVTNGTATCTTSTSPVGTDTINASYSGDSNYNSTSASTPQQVDPATTPMTVTAGPANAAPGDPVVITATVPAGATGSITFTDGSGNPICTAVINPSTGTASCTTTTLPLGTDTINANYPGDTNHAPATGTTTETIAKVTPTMNVTVGPQNAAPGDPVVITATVPADATGSITFTDGNGNPICTATINSGVATCTTTTLPAGTDTINVNYPGDSKYTPASGTGTETITKVTPAITVTSSPNPSTSGQAVTITATVPSDAHGTVTFTDASNNPICTATISAGTASCMTTTLPVGTDPITANYSGDGKYVSSNTARTSQTVNPISTTTTTTVSATTVDAGSPVNITSVVGPADAAGSVTFYDNGVPIPGCTSLPLVNGRATCSGVVLPAGTDQITTTYAGNGTYSPSTSAPVAVVVNAGPVTADFAVALSPTSKYVAPGASVSYNVQVTSVNGVFNNLVNLTLTVDGVSLAQAISGATYTMIPAAVTPGANGATSTLTIAVPAQHAGNTTPSNTGSKAPFALAILLLPLAAIKRVRGKLLLCVVMMLVAVGAMTGCSPGGYFGQPQKSYTIMVTGTSGTLQHNSNTAQMIVE